MAETIQHLNDQYGSPENYLQEIGISDGEIRQLRKRLCKPSQTSPDSTSVGYNGQEDVDVKFHEHQ